MHDSPGLPAYPPSRNAWEFPPPPVGRRWKWVAIIVTAVTATAALGLTVAAIVLDAKDYPGIIQDTTLVEVIGDECRLMRSTVESIPVTGSVRQQARAITDQNQAVQIMLAAIRDDAGAAIDDDRPTQEWLADWSRLVEARASYAVALATGSSDVLAVPLDGGGREIQHRMNDVWLDDPGACTVPAALLSPHAETDAEI